MQQLLYPQVDSPECLGTLPSIIRLVLLDEASNTPLQTSEDIYWDNLHVDEEVYQVEWSSVNMRDNGHYQLVIVSQSTYSQAISDPFPIGKRILMYYLIVNYDYSIFTTLLMTALQNSI